MNTHSPISLLFLHMSFFRHAIFFLYVQVFAGVWPNLFSFNNFTQMCLSMLSKSLGYTLISIGYTLISIGYTLISIGFR